MLISAPRRRSSYRHEITVEKWSGRKDLNLRPPGPEPGALARLRYAPTEHARPQQRLERNHNISIAPQHETRADVHAVAIPKQFSARLKLPRGGKKTAARFPSRGGPASTSSRNPAHTSRTSLLQSDG